MRPIGAVKQDGEEDEQLEDREEFRERTGRGQEREESASFMKI